MVRPWSEQNLVISTEALVGGVGGSITVTFTFTQEEGEHGSDSQRA
jgi:hypothetical protein